MFFLFYRQKYKLKILGQTAVNFVVVGKFVQKLGTKISTQSAQHSHKENSENFRKQNFTTIVSGEHISLGLSKRKLRQNTTFIFKNTKRISFMQYL